MVPDRSVDIIQRMEALLANPGFQSDLAQVRSKATLKAVGSVGPSPSWTYVANRFSRNSSAALYALEETALANPTDFPPLYRARARQLALAWESLSRLDEGASRSISLINAALAYELAGYQANAAYLAKELLPNPTPTENIDSLSLMACLIQRRLILTKQIASRILTTPPDETLPLAGITVQLADVVLADGLAKASSFFLSGDTTAYNEAIELFQQARQLFDHAGSPLQSNAAFGMQSILPQMKQRSTWDQLEVRWQQSEVWRRYLTLLARPMSRGVTELWPSQIKVIESGLLDTDRSSIVRLPTSGGKTRVAEMSIIDTFERHPGSKCVYVAPYRALAFEVERTLGLVLSDLGYRVSTVTGSYESDEFEAYIFGAADLIIATPEKLDLLLRLHPETTDLFRLIVLDEVHMIDDPHRGVKFELLISRIKRRIPDMRFLVTSAVIPDESLRAFSSWLAGSPNRSVTSGWRPTIQRRARFEWAGKTGVIRFEHDEEVPRLNTFVPGIIQQQSYVFRNSRTRRMNSRSYPTSEKGETAAELAYAFSEQGPVLVFCTQPGWVESVCKAIINKSIHYRRLTNRPVHSHFRNTLPTRSLAIAREWLGEDHILTKSLSVGIAPHHGRIPNAVREAIEVDCRAGHYRVIVATNTLAQGVNLPVRTVVIHSTWRSNPDGNRSRIPIRDYWNIAGRAGRAGMETEGLVVHITLNRNDGRDYRHYGSMEQIEPISGALFGLLEDIVISRISEESLQNAASILDPEILAIAVEEAIDTPHSDLWETSFQGAYVTSQAQSSSVDIAPLIDSARIAAHSVFDLAPDPEQRRLYAQTGLSTHSCDSVRKFVVDHADDLRKLMRSDDFGDLSFVHRLAVDASLQLSEAQTTTGFSGDVDVLLNLWVEGHPIDKIGSAVLEIGDSTEQLSRFIEDLFGYRMPWIVSGVFRIAQAELGIPDEEVSDLIRSYPSMIKYGVPDPIASWAMSAGISAREVALRLAEAFESERPSSVSHEGFIDWLAEVSDDSLRHDYSVEGFVLDELRYKLGRMVVNPFLRPLRPLHEFLPLLTDIAGIEYENRRFVARRVAPGDELTLSRDYENPVDANAISVLHAHGHLGFLPRHLAQRLAPELDSGREFFVQAVRYPSDKRPQIRAKVSLR